MIATVAGRRVDLTPTEFRLLLELARQPGRVFTRSQLLVAVQGVAFESYERAIDAHVKNIRRKIEDDPRAPRRLQTVFGVGYRMAEEAAAEPDVAPAQAAAPATGGRPTRHGRRPRRDGPRGASCCASA